MYKQSNWKLIRFSFQMPHHMHDTRWNDAGRGLCTIFHKIAAVSIKLYCTPQMWQQRENPKDFSRCSCDVATMFLRCVRNKLLVFSVYAETYNRLVSRWNYIKIFLYIAETSLITWQDIRRNRWDNNANYKWHRFSSSYSIKKGKSEMVMVTEKSASLLYANTILRCFLRIICSQSNSILAFRRSFLFVLLHGMDACVQQCIGEI